MPTLEQQLRQLSATEPPPDPAADAMATRALRAGARSRQMRHVAALGAACAVLTTTTGLLVANIHDVQYAQPAAHPTPGGKGSVPPAGWGQTAVDPTVFRTAVTRLVPGSHPQVMSDTGTGTSIATDGRVDYAERHNATWRAEVAVSVQPKEPSVAPQTCADYSAPFTCTETRVANGTLRVATVRRGNGHGTVSPFVWLSRNDGTTITLALTGPTDDVDRTTLTRQQAVTVVTSPLWNQVVRS